MSRDDALLLAMGERIHKRRKDLNLSQEKLAETAGISPRTILTAENGQKALRPENIVSICKVLDMDVEYLLTGVVSEKSIFSNDEIKKMSAGQLKELKEIVSAFIRALNLR